METNIYFKMLLKQIYDKKIMSLMSNAMQLEIMAVTA